MNNIFAGLLLLYFGLNDNPPQFNIPQFGEIYRNKVSNDFFFIKLCRLKYCKAHFGPDCRNS